MRLILTVLMVLGLGFSSSVLRAADALNADNVRSLSPSQVEAALPQAHPAMYYVYAARLFSEGHKDDAVRWFYIGQLRYRFFLLSNPGLPQDGEPALMASLNAGLGKTINEWAGGDPIALAAQIDKALDWDKDHPNGFTSKEQHAKEWQELRAGLAGLRDMYVTNADKIRAQRAQRGLPNR